ncbi:Acyltransferase family protein [Pseudobutyrivibrio sp. UC1225]|nr:acyltransferase family protein [Pseudobutyrivibrio sp. UC1225]SFO21753.1 Acyltransferase family protein [Pseudobutyrivibrio sp. UC1225]
MERKVYCDYLRFFAVFAVCVLHVSAFNWACTDVNSLEWQVFNFYESIVRWGVPIFLMISGTLFLNREISIKKLFSKYIFRMVVAFVFWSLFYAFDE